MDHTIVHFEIPASNVKTLSEFYSKLFGWKFTVAPGDYWLIETAPQGKGVNGGMMKKQPQMQSPINYIGVESVADYAAKAQNLGAKVVMPKMPITGVGYFAVILDLEGNAIGLFQDDKNVN